MHSPHNDHNDPRNDSTINTENMIDIKGNENEAEDEDKNEHDDLKETPTKNDGADAECDNRTDPDTVFNTMDKQYGART